MPLSDAMQQGTQAQLEQCTSCAAGTLRRDRVSTALWRGGGLVVIEGIPALVCQSCGERYFEDETAMTLDLMRTGEGEGESPARVMSVPVYAYTPPGGRRQTEAPE